MIRDTSAQDRRIAAPPVSRRKTVGIAVGVLAVLLMTGFAVPSMQRWLSASRSVSGDRLRITVFDQANLTNVYTVDASGNISMPLIGGVPAPMKERIASMIMALAQI